MWIGLSHELILYCLIHQLIRHFVLKITRTVDLSLSTLLRCGSWIIQRTRGAIHTCKRCWPGKAVACLWWQLCSSRQRSESEKMSTHQSVTILEGLLCARQQIISLRFKEVKRKIILGSLLALKFWDYCLWVLAPPLTSWVTWDELFNFFKTQFPHP